jgi:hypothetical protein
MIYTHHCIQVIAGQARDTDDAIVIEDRFELLLNDQPVTAMVASRDQLQELGAGYLVSEGILRCVDKVKVDGTVSLSGPIPAATCGGRSARSARPEVSVLFRHPPGQCRISGSPLTT